ncbi:MAG: MmcQ/YjbR family DNA-binding protein [Cytophagales bacterium]|nr:MAG: MmcQ/YjbR family DNA-binding protein [Cytophagales bacterium]
MNIEELRVFCLSLKGTYEELPFDENTLVFKVMGKIFLLTDIADFGSINVKCDPERAVELRERYECVKAGYHMNKKHWNTIEINRQLSDNEINQWILHSYELVVSKLNKADKVFLNEL